MHTNIASNVAHSVKEKIYGSEYINLSALLLTNPTAKQGTQTLLFKGIIRNICVHAFNLIWLANNTS
jgi:hypothetical protein